MGSRPNAKDWWRKLPEALSRVDILGILEGGDPAARTRLAARADAAPEVLYFLASEGEADVRRAAAANPATPAHANRRLADDDDDDVRAELARKIGRLFPGLSRDQNERARALTIETLERLADDALPRVRAILAEEIKTLDCIPGHVVRKLARDVERVAAPILEFSPLLSDADLIEIVTTAHASFAVRAVARRKPLGADVADVIVEARDNPAIEALLENAEAQIREKTFEKIAEAASKQTRWHRSLIGRNDLPQRVIRRIAGFVCAALLEQLAARNGLDAKTRRHLAHEMQARLAAEEGHKENPAAKNRIANLYRKGRLDSEAVERAVEAGEKEAVIQALALLASVPPDAARRILESRSPKPIAALVWRAGLSMRIAFKIQTCILKLSVPELLHARGGVDFPLDENEMRWHLGYFGVRA